MIGAVGGIKAPAAIAVDRQAGDGGADGCIGSRLAKHIHIVGSELSGDSGSVFCGELGCGEGCDRRIIGTGDGERDDLRAEGTSGIGNLNSEGVGDGLPCRKALNGGGRAVGAVIEVVGPGTGVAGEGEGAVGAAGTAED